MDNRPPLIRAERLSKSYRVPCGWVHALRTIDLRLYRGESLALMGPSGSGKSTLLHLLGCLDSPSSGRYWFDNREVSSSSDETLSRLRADQIGFVFQSFHLIPQLNVFENIALPLHYGGARLSDKEIRERVGRAIDEVQLERRLHHLPGELSGGEMQRTAIARALVVNPLLILADEPTGNLDRETGKTILRLFQSLNERGTTLIISTHDREAATYCQRFVCLLDGKIGNCS